MYQFLHIAQNDPERAANLCNRYGWQFTGSYEDIAQGLLNICDEYGDDGTRDVMNLLPEKQLILHFFSKADDSCPHCKDLNRMRQITTPYAAADGTVSTGSSQQIAQNSHALSTALENNKLMVFGFLTLVAIVLIKS